MVIYRGRVLAAWGDVARRLELHSVRKSLYAAMYGVAVDQGLVDVSDTLAELGVDDLQKLTDEEKQATLEDLLYARSGVYHPAAYAPADQARNRPARGSKAHGTHWFYNNWDFNVAGALLERPARKPVGNAFDEWIAKPVGMEDYQPSDVFAALEPSRSQWPAHIFRMSTRDVARFGQLWLQRGRWNGRACHPERSEGSPSGCTLSVRPQGIPRCRSG
jgi:CubicO group peptidase (beta-lactamase class C family)